MDASKSMDQVLVEEFRNLMREIAERKSHNLVRFRKAGQPWQSHFLQVYDADKGGIFYDHQDKEFVFVTDLSEIIEFQLSNPSGLLAAETTYEVMPIKFF